MHKTVLRVCFDRHDVILNPAARKSEAMRGAERPSRGCKDDSQLSSWKSSARLPARIRVRVGAGLRTNGILESQHQGKP